MFLTTGAPWVAHKDHIKHSLLNPTEVKPRAKDRPHYNDDKDIMDDAEIEQTVEENKDDILSIQAEILRELGR